jgi:hypothetical protein
MDKLDSAVQASLSLPVTPVGKGMDHPFINPKSSGQQPCLLTDLGGNSVPFLSNTFCFIELAGSNGIHGRVSTVPPGNLNEMLSVLKVYKYYLNPGLFSSFTFGAVPPM